MNEHPLKKLQSLFRELFQLDLADLDFGLYRLFHLKRAEIEAFISEQLPREVDAAFRIVGDEEREKLRAELDALAREVQEQIAEDAILPTGEIKSEYLNSSAKVVRELAERYESVRQKVAAVQVAEEVTEKDKADVFNYLYDFFRRYYEDGDFIPKRRYGARETYAVPYNGEEVFFYWANRDQHYVKTAERFRDYAFKLDDLTGEYRVRFVMTEASIPKDNTKGNARYFFPRPDLASYDVEAREFTLPFEYRLPTPEEAERYGNNSKAQEAILEEALPRVLEVVPDSDLRVLLGRPINEGEDAPTLLQKRLRHFCRRNTSDYFIHKNLAGFLTRELEFYIKDQIIHLMDIEADLDAKRRVVKTFRKLAEEVIKFLATIEDAQKTLFEKKKFVLETDYLIPVRHVPREFWPEILCNNGQLLEWQRWLAVEGEVNEAFLEAHPTLPVYTRHFDRGFVRRLLEALPFEDLDEATDGLLVHGENYQALRLLMERYREQVKCIYIDPPYNTGSDEFIYKDRYQHSSWLAMMEERLRIAWKLMLEDGVIFVSIDDGEQAELRKVLEAIFGKENFINNIIWQKKYTRANDARWFSDNHDFIITFAKDKHKFSPVLLPRTEKQRKGYSNPDNDPRGPWKATPLHAKSGTVQSFTYTFANGVVWSPPPGTYPRYSVETLKKLELENRIWFGPEGKGVPAKKTFLSEVREGMIPVTIWPYNEVGHNHEAVNEIKMLFPKNPYSSPKPTRLIARIAQISGGDVILDFFAGSGTTGHVVINLNHADGRRRKFILVEMGECFDTVLLPRIAKVMYTPEWKDGKPKRGATPEEAERTPRLVKILRLESYEDTLHNLAVTAERLSASKEARKREQAYKALAGEDTYRLRYWIELPLKEAETCLRALDLAHPFNYTLEVLTDNGPIKKPVNLVETFNYLYGLRVKCYETWYSPDDGNREYRVVKATDRESKRHILVLWRDMKGLNPEVERAFLEDKITEMKLEGEVWDEILINGASPTPGVVSLDPLFKQLVMGDENE
ncbi:adenine-specific DNA-methyltransferase [Thermodesulfitimonas autotrophica]|uniref:Adenine-specific DNA-methyltransferase n=1 Tax=Thermodesulfitimonas autotrophica TaxID=1894989 RepID=A0A3N5AX57_9THEO|nr:site-specific DNA-methyltransferase [Thermodesulfitimonas autotrophica]RPF49473.1 adenine-specific DNA-methyltransferase [Thermodesulfitimonas autotrophica]